MAEHKKSRTWMPPSIRELNLGAVTNAAFGPVGDREEAAKIVLRAAERGDARSQLAMGFLYADGAGVPADRVAALMWTELATAHGKGSIADDAGKLLGHLSMLMPEAEIAKARQLARAWKPKPA